MSATGEGEPAKQEAGPLEEAPEQPPADATSKPTDANGTSKPDQPAAAEEVEASATQAAAPAEEAEGGAAPSLPPLKTMDKPDGASAPMSPKTEKSPAESTASPTARSPTKNQFGLSIRRRKKRDIGQELEAAVQKAKEGVEGLKKSREERDRELRELKDEFKTLRKHLTKVYTEQQKELYLGETGLN
uniref:Uncharacterized protein n=1 Tax=Chromera velia CCMP2878 TaxID=1169474 RepID=A0A0G4GNG3_9ALVE|mmetsp:Transcript_49783/g.98108  ORF Transcript_49783/g.98108 Transcript_49783/m.98108 type:complete len:188 (+) Transcript_49783:86-649(+)|eukprot:Cvel_22689.t1-p1 / transcript=Cvel_22689.t1 / gene=Cvel_22689 / organism=Chromera_velia_CCMP2878 / gene_product=hypothetical protein / transcript_product=hypothetical protein / location=Cvel_scaffold2258:27466-28026(+) / protein_length=187 / sequence_SO=supercontig / SO=protein_coding / is_pseudo=false